MFCSVCRQHASEDVKTNSFIVGTINLKLEAIKDHESSKCHIEVKKRAQGKAALENTAAMKALTSLKTAQLDKMIILFRNALSLVDLILTVPASTADCERGFNQMKLVKSDGRSRLTSRSLCDLLLSSSGPTVQLSSPSIENYDPTPAIQLWHQASIRPRRPQFMEGKKNTQESTSETSESDPDEQE
ncbi:hypothetical protein ABG768_024875 [Culter alburnus]|uniref:HAT C-terminal dimerisation domain-containing protein n=1 Tax=Culter alburnus TaxID=194366 RepID=A0AAW2AG36_CULAL